MTLEEFMREWNNGCSTLCIQTSGSTGVPKKITVEKQRMLASARMTCNMLNLKKGDTALLCMPLDYIAGKMMAVRSIEREMELLCVTPNSHPLQSFAGTGQKIDLAAFVPLQIAKTLEIEEEKNVLSAIKHVLIGGGAIDEQIEEALKTFPNNIYSTYGMTETLSHIALRRISGAEASLWYTPMPQVSIELSPAQTLIITAPHLSPEPLETNDIAEINERGQFRILGRRDNTINTGGIKVQIENIEEKLHQAGLKDIQITAVPDSTFGEAIVMLTATETTESFKRAINTLPPYWKPKHILKLNSLPLTETGKPNRAEARAIAQKLIYSKT